MTKPVITQKEPYAVQLEADKNYAWCACGLSKNQPFCDGAHKETDFKPVIFQVEEAKTAYLCGCKMTGNGPMCDGTHKNI